MADDVFGEATWQRGRDHSPDSDNMTKRKRPLTDQQIRRRRGNYYAQYIRKFSLGNGPKDLVDDYLTNKEQGKMLGTLVALALARMKRLETFIWDMPTGILGDVWTSLSYLGEREDCRLERLWVRWHDNAALAREQSEHIERVEALGRSLAPRYGLERVEHPNFSELPPLKSLSVLDIDELQYLDEMSVLIERSLDQLRELRVGIAKQTQDMDWTKPWDIEGAEQIDHANPTRSTATISQKRLGGVLGVLTGRFHDLKQRNPPRYLMRTLRRRSSSAQLASQRASESNATSVQSPTMSATVTGDSVPGHSSQAAATIRAPSTDGPSLDRQSSLESLQPSSPEAERTQPPPKPVPATSTEEEKPSGDAPKLRLKTLELERVTLHLPVLQNALDWSKLTSLTLLDCPNHDLLWKALRREYAPRESATLRIKRSKSLGGTPKATVERAIHAPNEKIPLQLKHICTDTVTPSLLSFIREALPENSLEAIYFQDPAGLAAVDMETIFRKVIKRHRSSLCKVYIESCKHASPGSMSSSLAWKKWSLNRNMLKFATSKMPHLRELGMCIDHGRDWYYLLQRLPHVSQLRSLYIRKVMTYTDERDVVSPKDLALQILHTVTLRPEMELCYIGIMEKCYEILEGKRDGESRSERGLTSLDADDASGLDDDVDEEDDDGGEEIDDDDDDDDDHDEQTTAAAAAGPNLHDDSDVESEVVDSSDTESEGDEKVRLRLREILFYDDKISVFKARHGRL